MKLLLIALGGAAGTILRYLVAGIDYGFSKSFFPVGTLVVNLSGAFVIGLLWGLFEESNIPPAIRMPIFIGVLGGYTTFSTFALESFNLMRDGEYIAALINILASNILGIALVFIGFILAKFLILNFKGALR